jgi:hypothetical protein
VSLSLAIAFSISCCSDTTSSTHLVSVNTTQFVWDITTNNTFVNDTSNAARADLLTRFQEYQAETPGQYLFGFSGRTSMILRDQRKLILIRSLTGCCRVYANNSKQCTKGFAQSPDILTTILTDINALSNTSDPISSADIKGPTFASMRSSYVTTSKAYTAIITTSIVWTLIATIFVNIFASNSLYHLFLTIPGVTMAVVGAAMYTWCTMIQFGAYELSENYAAMAFGPGAFLLWAWMICIMLLTPLTAMISIVVVLALLLIMLWIMFLCAICVLACFGCGGGGGNQNDDPYNPGYNDPYPYPGADD